MTNADKVVVIAGAAGALGRELTHRLAGSGCGALVLGDVDHDAVVIHLTKVAALEYARDNIRVNCVCPGAFKSPIHVGLPDEALEAMAARHPLDPGDPGDVVGAFLYLAGDDAGWTTGAAVVVDSGYSAP